MSTQRKAGFATLSAQRDLFGASFGAPLPGYFRGRLPEPLFGIQKRQASRCLITTRAAGAWLRLAG
jgi:hypothetical protein